MSLGYPITHWRNRVCEMIRKDGHSQLETQQEDNRHGRIKVIIAEHVAKSGPKAQTGAMRSDI